MQLSTPILATLALAFAGNAWGFWRMNCANIALGRIDTVVSPGSVSSHVHTIVGGSNFGINATYNSLLNSDCTSCEIAADKSAYWSPQLFYSYPNGTFITVPNGGSTVYYLGRGPNVNSTVPFPKGFKSLSGNPAARSYDNTTMTYGTARYPPRPVADRVSFNCLDDGPPLPEKPYMFRTACRNGLRAQIHFPSCWNGKDLHKSDQSHVTYLSAIDNGVCPETHPYQLPHIFMETLYSTANVKDQSPGGRFVFANGDPTGYGFHADFQNGWETGPLADAVANCLATDDAGQISACPALQASQTSSYRDNCPPRPPQIPEKVDGLLDKLPGCIEVTEGPGRAPLSSLVCPPDVPQPVAAQTVDTTPLRTDQPRATGQSFGLEHNVYLGCYTDAAGSQRTLNGASYNDRSVMSVEFCQKYCTSRGFRLSGVEFTAECFCGSAINPIATAGSTECTWRCGAGITNGGIQEICGGSGAISIYNNTDPNFEMTGSTPTSATPSSAPSSSAVPPPSSTTSGNVASPSQPANPNYLGCYTDSSSIDRTLANGAYGSWPNMTVAVCAAFCQTGNSGLGYQFYGMEFNSECFCSNSIASTAKLLTPTTTPANTACSYRCSGNSSEICGGSAVVSVYNNTNYRAPQIKSSAGKYVSKGCLTDPNSSGRSLQGASTASSSMTVESCTNFCLSKGYRYAGLEYASECFCGNEIRFTTGVQNGTCSEAQMSKLMVCSGDKTSWCGGGNLMNLYYSSSV